jgi:hypothetical protein
MKIMDTQILTPTKQTKYTEELNEHHKSTLKEEILQVMNKNFIEMLLGMVNQNLKEALK